jgi:hypothetical protein
VGLAATAVAAREAAEMVEGSEVVALVAAATVEATRAAGKEEEARAAGAIIPDVAIIHVTILVISDRQARVDASLSAIFPRGRWELLKVSEWHIPAVVDRSVRHSCETLSRGERVSNCSCVARGEHVQAGVCHTRVIPLPTKPAIPTRPIGQLRRHSMSWASTWAAHPLTGEYRVSIGVKCV